MRSKNVLGDFASLSDWGADMRMDWVRSRVAKPSLRWAVSRLQIPPLLPDVYGLNATSQSLHSY